jgi:hypothetical protein
LATRRDRASSHASDGYAGRHRNVWEVLIVRHAGLARVLKSTALDNIDAIGAAPDLDRPRDSVASRKRRCSDSSGDEYKWPDRARAPSLAKLITDGEIDNVLHASDVTRVSLERLNDHLLLGEHRVDACFDQRISHCGYLPMRFRLTASARSQTRARLR